MTTIANKYFHTLSAYGIEQAIEEGKDWYPNAYKFCKFAAKHHDVTPQRVAAMLAVTSPRARWSNNTLAVAMLLEDMHKPAYKHQKYYGILGANARKGMLVANDRYYSRHVTGPKVSTFYLNILGWQEPVTVDSIMSKAAGYGSDVNNRIRTEVTDAVNTLGQVIGLSPRDTQAAVWIAYRGTPA